MAKTAIAAIVIFVIGGTQIYGEDNPRSFVPFLEERQAIGRVSQSALYRLETLNKSVAVRLKEEKRIAGFATADCLEYSSVCDFYISPQQLPVFLRELSLYARELGDLQEWLKRMDAKAKKLASPYYDTWMDALVWREEFAKNRKLLRQYVRAPEFQKRIKAVERWEQDIPQIAEHVFLMVHSQDTLVTRALPSLVSWSSEREIQAANRYIEDELERQKTAQQELVQGKVAQKKQERKAEPLKQQVAQFLDQLEDDL